MKKLFEPIMGIEFKKELTETMNASAIAAEQVINNNAANQQQGQAKKVLKSLNYTSPLQLAPLKKIWWGHGLHAWKTLKSVIRVANAQRAGIPVAGRMDQAEEELINDVLVTMATAMDEKLASGDVDRTFLLPTGVREGRSKCPIAVLVRHHAHLAIPLWASHPVYRP